MSKRIPIFFACDDNFVKYTIVTLTSIIENASKDYLYNVHVLNTNITEEMKQEVYKLQNENFSIEFNDVTSYLESISSRLPIRDYYSKTTYFRLFIAEMFRDYEKAIYIDSDTVVLGDISELYNYELGDNLVGACNEQAMVQVDEYGTYAEQCVGVDRNKFFNAGMILINCNKFREEKVLDQFINLLFEYNFVVTKDEDYLNVICKDRVLFIPQVWNMEVFGEIPYKDEEIKMLHYIMVSKPWHFADCRYSNFFWKYAKMTSVYNLILKDLCNYTDEQRANDIASVDRLKALAVSETNKENNFIKSRTNKAKDRLEVIEKIKQLESEGKFDVDVEQDPPTKPLLPNKIDYTRKKILSKLKSRVAFGVARKFLNKIIAEKQMIIKEVKGIENLKNLESGAIITCNHFNAFDSFAMHVVYEMAEQKKRKLFRVIREGNYTNFPGFYGFLMRNCNTLPLSSNKETMKLFMRSVDQLLKDGHFILVYPEQSMWWNYRKPKPLKKGAYSFAAKANVPVVPCFITMEDSNIMGEDGFYIQEYTIHVGKPIYPNENSSKAENIDYLMNENYVIWKEVYEDFYQTPLKYNTR